MSITKPKLSSLVAKQLPEFVREDHQTFVKFLEAYYEYLDNNSYDLKTLRDVDTTLDSFLKYFRDEIATNIPSSAVSQRFLLQHIKEQYLSKGSEASFNLLFRLLYNKEITVDYPSKQMLRASDGKWNQDVSIICKVLSGSPDSIVGKLVDIVTPNKIIRVLVDRRQDIEVEVERVVQLATDTFEFYIDRRFFGNINIGDRLRYGDGGSPDYFSAEILGTTSKLEILDGGTGFKVGDLYPIRNGNGYGSILKVTRVNSVGKMLAAEFIKFGVGYTTEFTTTILAQAGQATTGSSGTVISIIGSSVNISDSTDGFSETGTINKADYWQEYGDGTYAGDVLREFGVSNIDQQISTADPAIIKITLGSLAKYPGYYTNNDGFLNDAIYIQDSRYYQAFSYVLKIDEQLENYRSVVKTLIHPAGMALFGEYDVRNEFDISLDLESLLKILAVSVQDEALVSESITYKGVTKGLEDFTLGFSEVNTISMHKPLYETISETDEISTKHFGKSAVDSISETDEISTKHFGKSLNGVSEQVGPVDNISARDFGKLLQDSQSFSDEHSLTVTKYIDPTISGIDETTPVDSGGFMILNPYADAGWFLEQYVGEPINF